jgi:uncharacterized protein (TIGR02145 family)
MAITVIGAGCLTLCNAQNASFKTVTIGGKKWMAENLNIQTADSWCYDNDYFNCAKYGRLYTWGVAKTVCPGGWHLPSREEWDNLVMAAGGKNVAGKNLKARSGWNEGGNGTDRYDFSALPGGYRNSDGNFYGVRDYGGWWTATEGDASTAYRRFMLYYSDSVGEYGNYKYGGFTVRCVGD